MERMENSTSVTSAALLKTLAEVSENLHTAMDILETENNHLVEIHAALSGMNAERVWKMADTDSESKSPSVDTNVRQVITEASRVPFPTQPTAHMAQTRTTATESIIVERDGVVDILEGGRWSQQGSLCRGKATMTKDHLYDNIVKSVTRSGKRFSGKRADPSVTFLQDYAAMQGWLHRKSRRANGNAVVKLGPRFDSVCAIIIVLNSVFLAIATDYSARHSIGEQIGLPVIYIVLDYAFGIWFLIELILRIAAEGTSFFSCFTVSGNWVWNYFDTLVVFLYFIEVIFRFLSAKVGGANLTSLRLLRVLRIARALRVVRVLRIFKELRMMVMSVLNSFMTLVWAMLLLFFMFLVFAILLTENVNSYLYKDDASVADDARGLMHDFGSIDHAVYTLFAAVTGGRNWQEISDQLFTMNWTSGVLFCFYIFFTNFAMLNIITGIFLETALNSCKSDQAELIHEQLTAEDSSIKALQKLFEAADEDQSGAISADEFDKHLSDPVVRAHLASLGVNTGEAEGLFRLLDLDNSGVVSLEEFLYGCMRMKGEAKAVDVATLMYENKKMFGKWNILTNYIEQQFRMRKTFEDQLAVLLEKIRISLRSKAKPALTVEETQFQLAI